MRHIGPRTAMTLLGVLSPVLLVAACGSSSLSTSAPSASACHPAHHVHTVEAGTLSVGVYPYPPYGYQAGNKLAGVDGTLLTRIAAMECLQVKPVPGAASAMISDVLTGRADTIMGDWHRTVPRAKIVLLSAPAYVDPMVLVSKSGVNALAQLKGTTLGSVLGFNWDAPLEKVFGSAFKLYPTDKRRTPT